MVVPDTATIADFIPDSHSFNHFYLFIFIYLFPRENERGGGVGFAMTKQIKTVKSIERKFDSFECLEIDLKLHNRQFKFFMIYWPSQNCFRRFREVFRFFLT